MQLVWPVWEDPQKESDKLVSAQTCGRQPRMSTWAGLRGPEVDSPACSHDALEVWTCCIFQAENAIICVHTCNNLREKAANWSVQNLVHLQEQQEDWTELQQEFDLKTGDERITSLALKSKGTYGIHRTLSTWANLHLSGHFTMWRMQSNANTPRFHCTAQQ